eukprot:2677290-Pleurochrysis_carterae.AAC.1
MAKSSGMSGVVGYESSGMSEVVGYESSGMSRRSGELVGHGVEWLDVTRRGGCVSRSRNENGRAWGPQSQCALCDGRTCTTLMMRRAMREACARGVVATAAVKGMVGMVVSLWDMGEGMGRSMGVGITSGRRKTSYRSHAQRVR